MMGLPFTYDLHVYFEFFFDKRDPCSIHNHFADRLGQFEQKKQEGKKSWLPANLNILSSKSGSLATIYLLPLKLKRTSR